VEYRVLGPLEVLDRDRSLPLAGAKQRALLALLSRPSAYAQVPLLAPVGVHDVELGVAVAHCFRRRSSARRATRQECATR